MSKKGGGGERGTSTERVGGGGSTSSTEGRTREGQHAEWQHSSAADLPAPSVAEEVVKTVSGTQDTPPVSFTQIAAQSSAETISEVARAATPSSHDVHHITHEGVSRGIATEAATHRPVIAVSTMKGPAAFFNLARKFLVSYETCDLSALEGAIIAAVDAAHLLERSRLATIARVETSYVAVEPRRKRQGTPARSRPSSVTESHDHRAHIQNRNVISTHKKPHETAIHSEVGPGIRCPVPTPEEMTQPSVYGGNIPLSDKSRQILQQGKGRVSARGKELRRARIIITVKRTEEYRRWLEENPQPASSGKGDGGPSDAKELEPSSLPPTK